MTEAVETGKPAPVNVKDLPEFKEALAREREEMRAGFDAEYRRKQQELEAARQTPEPTGNKRDWFEDWAERHGLPANAGRELVTGAVEYFQAEVLPKQLAPLSQSAKKQELRSQRSELRASNPRLAKMDDRFHTEAMKILETMPPNMIGADSYARALHMVIGQNIETIETERENAAKETVERETETHVPGPEPVSSGAGGSKPKATILNAKQKQFCEEKGMKDSEFAEMMIERARNMEVRNGMNKNQVRARLGDMLGSLEF